MNFLQPFVLWGLPLALLPILIHLLNRMRYRTQPWAAMSFLFSANRASTRNAKLRQFLLLACRVMAVIALVGSIARPIAGGWLGWAFSPAPDLILVLLDRSASMEVHDTTHSFPRREQALRQIADAAAPYVDRSRFFLMENTLKKPQEIARPDFQTLSTLNMAGPTDTTADIPAMLDAATEWLKRNQIGSTEIWIASDSQTTNWQPESNRWTTVTAHIAALQQTVRVRILALTSAAASDLSVALLDVTQQKPAGKATLNLVLDLKSNHLTTVPMPISITLDDARVHLDVTLTDRSMRLHRALPLESIDEYGWGKVELPSDANLRNNTAFFVHGPKPALRCALIASDEQSRFFLRLAVKSSKQDCDVISASETNAVWQKYGMVLWQGALPGPEVGKQLERFVHDGGVCLFFPPAASDSNSFGGASWGTVENAAQGEPFRILHWDEQDGPLAKSDEGLSLPVNAVTSNRRQIAISGGESVASFADSKAFLTQRPIGHGSLFLCATLPNSDWSTLGNGRVLVPLIQRLLDLGGKRFDNGSFFLVGDPSFMEDPNAWKCVDGPKKDIRFEAGIYRNGPKLIAVNRPAAEDDSEILEGARIKQLFGAVTMSFFEERGSVSGPMQGEIWRMLLLAMLTLLLVEGVLSLPAQSSHLDATKPSGLGKSRPTGPGKNKPAGPGENRPVGSGENRPVGLEAAIQEKGSR